METLFSNYNGMLWICTCCKSKIMRKNYHMETFLLLLFLFKVTFLWSILDTSCGPGSPCKDICHPTPRGPICDCSEGFVLLDNGARCADIDECENDDACAQVCTNTRGSFSCSCDHGFKLRSDQISCKAIGKLRVFAVQIVLSEQHKLQLCG
jgi:hypothetical protein